jgi:hypothetical protein
VPASVGFLYGKAAVVGERIKEKILCDFSIIVSFYKMRVKNAFLANVQLFV